jgi:hypothetical protein
MAKPDGRGSAPACDHRYLLEPDTHNLDERAGRPTAPHGRKKSPRELRVRSTEKSTSFGGVRATLDTTYQRYANSEGLCEMRKVYRETNDRAKSPLNFSENIDDVKLLFSGVLAVGEDSRVGIMTLSTLVGHYLLVRQSPMSFSSSLKNISAAHEGR